MNESYKLYKLRNHLHFLESKRPNIYEVLKPNGQLYATVFNEKSAIQLKEQGYQIRIADDIDDRIKKLRNRIHSLE